MLSAGVQSMTGVLLTVDGQTVSYGRIETGTVISPFLYRSAEQTAVIETGGQLTEIRYTDFIGLATAFTANPTRGDVITCTDGGVYEVRPLNGGKPYKLTLGQIRIHTQKIK